MPEIREMIDEGHARTHQKEIGIVIGIGRKSRIMIAIIGEIAEGDNYNDTNGLSETF